MRRGIFLLVAVGACNGTEVTGDGGVDASVDTSTLLDGACAKSVAAYCDAYACPSSAAAAIASSCGWNSQILEGCGYVNSVVAGGVDTSETLVFGPDGGLTGIEWYSGNTGQSNCLAGPADATSVPSCSCAQGCTIVDASCE